MNAHSPTLPADIQRRTFTVRDVERMAEVGVLTNDEHVELISGELIPMSPKGARHETIKRALLERWFAIRPSTISILPETTLRLSTETFIEPDFIVFSSKIRTADLSAEHVLLAVEIADSSLAFDLGLKAKVYAYFAIRELWVIDATADRIHVHRNPQDGRYAEVTVFEAEDLVTPAHAPAEFALRLSELEAETR